MNLECLYWVEEVTFVYVFVSVDGLNHPHPHHHYGCLCSGVYGLKPSSPSIIGVVYVLVSVDLTICCSTVILHSLSV